MKTISEYLIEAKNELNEIIDDIDKICGDYKLLEIVSQIAMQSRKQDHDLEIERLRVQLKRWEPLSDSQAKLISKISNDNNIKASLEWLKQKDVKDVQSLTLSQASEFIDFLLKYNKENKVQMKE